MKLLVRHSTGHSSSGALTAFSAALSFGPERTRRRITTWPRCRGECEGRGVCGLGTAQKLGSRPSSGGSWVCSLSCRRVSAAVVRGRASLSAFLAFWPAGPEGSGAPAAQWPQVPRPRGSGSLRFVSVLQCGRKVLSPQ